MKEKIDVIVILGGGLKKDKNGWRTTNFDEGDNFGGLGDRLRVVAAEFLARENPKVIVVVSGGRGQLRKVVGAPTVSEVLKKELMALGVAPERIIEKNNSNNTYQQLKELIKVLNGRGFSKIGIISNRHHLPRVQAMVEFIPDLKSLKDLLLIGNLELLSAEDILLDFDPNSWKDLISRAYASEAMQKRIELENQGVAQIKAGTYKLEFLDFKIRKAIPVDSEFLFSLRNEESVRKASFSSEPIALEDHQSWFKKVLADPSWQIYIIEVSGQPIAQVRFDGINEKEIEVNVAVSGNFQDKGYGSAILRETAKQFFKDFPDTNLIHAYIKPDNQSSLRSFGKADYQLIGEVRHKDWRCIEMTLNKFQS